MSVLKTAWANLQDGLGNRFSWSHVKAIFYNYAEQKLLSTKLDEMDALIDEKIAKAMMSNVQVNDETKVPTSALAYSMSQDISQNEQNIATLNSNKAPISHIHDDRYYTESEINSKLSGLLLTETIVISPTMSSVTCGGTYSLAKNGYTPIAITGWEIGANTAIFVQRCEINNQILNYSLRTTSNTPFSGQVYFDVTILYKKN